MIDYITKEVYEQAQKLFNDLKELHDEYQRKADDKNIYDFADTCYHYGYSVDEANDENARNIISYSDNTDLKPDDLEYIEVYAEEVDTDGNIQICTGITIYLKNNEFMFEVTDITVPFEEAEIITDGTYVY